MPALRIMTFNVQMLPLAATFFGGTTNDAEGRAGRVIAAIIGLPPAERPHVLVLNEVFSEDGRGILVKKLSSLFPHRHEKLWDGLLEEDAGLMIMSQFPFLPLKTGGNVAERFYGDSEGSDTLASKGVGMVRIATPGEGTFVVFSHLQASYSSEDEHRAIRVKQLDVIHRLLEDEIGGFGPNWRNVIVLGDLNIRGDSGAVSDEWSTVFDLGITSFGKSLEDGWRRHMHPPGIDDDVDQGFTNRDPKTSKQQRLDYICCAKPTHVAPRGLVPHRMRTLFRNESDHYAFEAVMQRHSNNCTPAEAIEVMALPPLVPGNVSVLRIMQMSIQDPGAHQWAFVKEEGTFTVHVAAGHVVQLFADNNLSDPLQPVDKLTVSQMPSDLQSQYGQFHRLLDPEGKTFVTRRPFFIAVTSKTDALSQPLLTVLQHRGETPETAIWLSPHKLTAAGFPSGQLLGKDDRCWFKAQVDPLFTGAERNEVFRLRNTTGTFASLEQVDAALNGFAKVSGSEPELTRSHSTLGNEVLISNLSRTDVNATGFAINWVSPVTYLRLREPLGLHVDDETGADWNGDDEIELSIGVDADPVALFDGSWDSADTDEEWGGLAETIRNTVMSRTGQGDNLAFASSLGLEYLEDDDVAQGSNVAFVQALGPSEDDIEVRRITLPVPDTISDGQYSFFCTLARFKN